MTEPDSILYNRLGEEVSPYLLQHADDPVAWQPWDAQALELARRLDRPIMLSIGYSACHWCHVMAHESFQDAQTAEILNRLFISIKVDREERPDLDKIYQSAQLLITQRSGGWPLTMFLSPLNQTPFFGGTYFPKQSRYGLPSFIELLEKVSSYYANEKEDLGAYGKSVQTALGKIFSVQSPADTSEINASLLAQQATTTLTQMFDQRHGGFGNEPKFPNGHFIDFLLKQSWRKTGDYQRSQYMALYTLENICRGGIYDQLGGGFCRYSVDERWAIPHFEKMLYDNASLLGLCATAGSITQNPLFLNSAHETASWILQDMQSPEGGYFSALDADSEGKEGEYYVWSKEEIESLCDHQNYPAFALRYGLSTLANFEGRWNLWQQHTIEDVAQQLSLTADDTAERISEAKQTLLNHRHSQRIPPQRDEKILTAWNGLMIKNMARCGYLLDKPEYLHSAKRAFDFIRNNLWDGQHLFTSYKDGQIKPYAFLDNYAFVIDSALELCQAQWDSDVFAFACRLADELLLQFEDSTNGGFFFTPHNHENLIQRPKALADEATPSGYGIACEVLLTLGSITANTTYLDAVHRALGASRTSLSQSPEHHCSILNAMLDYGYGRQTLIIRALPEHLSDWLAATAKHYNPARICFAIPADETIAFDGLADKSPRDDACAYLCQGTQCQPPLMSLQALNEFLQR